MKRRALLGTLVSTALAGCFGSDGGGTPVPETSTPPTRTTTDQPSQSTTEQSTQSGTPPEIRDLGVPVEQSDCPFQGEGVARVVCYPEQTGDPLSVTPSKDAVALPEGSLTFTLANDTTSTYSVNFYDWGLHKRVGGQWFYVTPRLIPEPLHHVAPGGSHEWTVEVDNSQEPSTGTSREDGGTVAGLGGGEYVFEVSGWFEEYSHGVGLGAEFELDGDQLELAASDDLAAERNGETVVASIEGEGEPTEAFVVERVGEAGVPPGKPIYDRIAEQLVRPLPGEERLWLRDGLALFDDGVTTVRVESAAEIEPVRFDRDQRHYVQFREDIYEAEVVSVE